MVLDYEGGRDLVHPVRILYQFTIICPGLYKASDVMLYQIKVSDLHGGSTINGMSSNTKCFCIATPQMVLMPLLL